MLVRHNVARRDALLIRQDRREARGPVDGCCLPGATPEFADFDSNALAVAHTPIVGVITLFRRQEVLDGLSVVDSEMPNNPARAAKPGVVLAALAFHKKVLGMIRGSRVHIRGRMDRKVARSHGSGDQPAMNIRRQKSLADARQSRTTMGRRRARGEKHADACQAH